MVVAPLDRAEFVPHVIVIYGNPAQISRLIEAAVYATGQPVISSNIGALACSEEITRTILTDRCQLIVAGGGDRIMAQTQDDEASFAIPIGKAEEIVEGLEGTHKRGWRYPTHSFLTYKAQFPPSFGELMDYLRQDD